jgi:glutamate-ammonia-ligase adenylyltransferase
MDTPPVLRLLVTLFAASPLLARAVIRRPYLLDSLVFQGRGPREKEQAEMAAELQALLGKAPDLDHALNACRRYQTEELVRIGLLDIGGGLSVEEVGRQLTRMADTLIEAVLHLTREALTESHGPMEGSLAIFGLGRLGSREMGYGSDIDIVFIYGGTAVGPEGKDRHTWFTRLAQRFVTNTSSLLYEGRLYEVDTRLRPSGSQGTLVSSFEAFRAYHEDGAASWWERQALAKCRFVAGERALEQPVLELVSRVVFRPDPPADLGAQMRRLRARLESEVAREKAGSYNVKLGRGGIMDIEFAVQYLQLMHGYEHEALRTGNVYEVLRKLKDTALLPAATTASLLEAYTFLRRLENRIRVVNDRPIEALDSTSVEAVRLARRMGYGDLLGSSAVDQLVGHYRRHTEAVRATYDALLPEESHGRQD